MKNNLITALSLLFICQIGFTQDIQQIDVLNEHSFKLRSSHKDSAFFLAKEALRFSHSLDYEKGIALANLNLGIQYCNRNWLDSAYSTLMDAKMFLTESNVNQHELAVCMWYFGKLNQKLGDFDRSFKFLKDAEELFKEQENDLFLIYVVTEQGVYHEMLGNYATALEKYLEVFNVRVIAGEQDIATHEYQNIANIYKKMGRYAEAKKFAKLSLQSSIRIGSKTDICVKTASLGRLYGEINEIDSATYYLMESYQMAIESKNMHLQIDALLILSEINARVKEYRKAVSNLLTLKSLDGISDNTLLIVYYELALNYLALSKPDSSVYYLHMTNSLAAKRGSKEYMQNASNMLMSHYQEIGVFDSAFYYSKRHKEVSDSIYNEKNAKRFNDLRVKLETIEKENQINSLKFEAYETKVRNSINYVLIGLIAISIIVLLLIYRNRQKHLEKRKVDLENQLIESRRKLSNHALGIVQRNNLLSDIKDELLNMNSKNESQVTKSANKIRSIINLNQSLENDWKNFSDLFNETHNDFFVSINNKHPDLSDYEVRLCALVKLNLSNKEIATILSIEHKSVKMAKYRLKKKLNVEGSLSSFIHGV